MLAAARIVFDVLVFRLRKLEMANAVAAASIAVALRLEIGEIVYRTLFALLLNAFVYLNNDYIDIKVDLAASDKDQTKSRFLAEHMREGLLAQWSLVGLLVIGALVHDATLLIPLIAGGGVCVLYSAKLKQQPYLDVLAMAVWGVTMPLCGVPADSLVGFAMALQLGLFSGVFEAIQVMRDADEDAVQGLRTTGTVLGKKRTLRLAKTLMVVVSVYALLVMHPLAAVLSLPALFIPFDDKQIERYWTRVKMVYGLAWLLICAWVFFYGTTSGVLYAFPRSATLW
jgi:4-hydroxybenzoate polyprenyltransferase